VNVVNESRTVKDIQKCDGVFPQFHVWTLSLLKF